jgi:hypothetical protein
MDSGWLKGSVIDDFLEVKTSDRHANWEKRPNG